MPGGSARRRVASVPGSGVGGDLSNPEVTATWRVTLRGIGVTRVPRAVRQTTAPFPSLSSGTSLALPQPRWNRDVLSSPFEADIFSNWL